jgi:hypothetical protein
MAYMSFSVAQKVVKKDEKGRAATEGDPIDTVGEVEQPDPTLSGTFMFRE